MKKPSEVFGDVNPSQFENIEKFECNPRNEPYFNMEKKEKYFCLYVTEFDLEYKKTERFIWMFFDKNKAYELMNFLIDNTQENIMGEFSLFIESNLGLRYIKKPYDEVVNEMDK